MATQKRCFTPGVFPARTVVPVLGISLMAILPSCAPAVAQVPPSPSPEVSGVLDWEAGGMAGAQEHAQEAGTIQVTGQAQVSLPADQALVTFAVETEGPSAGEAPAENARRMEAVLAAVRGAEVPELEVETFGYSLRPEYEVSREGSGTRSISGYRVQNHILVTVPEIDATGAVLDRAIDAGANRVANLRFEASDTREARLEALRQAVARAREEAQAIATAMGVGLGAVLEVQGGASAPNPRSLGGMMVRAAAEASTPIEGGDQMVTANVTVRFRILEGTR